MTLHSRGKHSTTRLHNFLITCVNCLWEIGLYIEVLSIIGKMASDPNNMTMPEFVQEANRIVAQVPMMPNILHVSVSLREKLEMFN